MRYPRDSFVSSIQAFQAVAVSTDSVRKYVSGGLSEAIIFEAPAKNIAQTAVTVAKEGRMVGVISQIELVGDEDE